jgi:8-hydroxy-5-deazaflavin:NADPH oxidoreductase
MRIAIVGGTGPFGRALAERLIEAGDEVVIGSREAARAEETAAALGAVGKTNEEAVGGVDLVVLAVDAGAVLESAGLLRSLLQTAPVLSVASELEFAAGSARPVPATHSLAERISDALDVPVVAGLHSLAARTLVRSPPDEDAFVCGNDREAKALALELADKVVAGRAIDAGPLAVARALEGMTAVLVNVNRRYKTHAGLRVTGLP